MIAFLQTAAGRWAIRLIAAPVGWILATHGLGWTWNGDGDAFLAVLFFVVVACVAFFVGYAVDILLSILPQPERGVRKRPFEGEILALSKAKQAEIRRHVAAMADAGVFEPDVPDAKLAFAAIAVDGLPVDWRSVLGALEQADYYHPDCHPKHWSANLIYDHLPADWRNPPTGKVLAYLWEDEDIVFSWVKKVSLETLGKTHERGTPWYEMDDEIEIIMRESGILSR